MRLLTIVVLVPLATGCAAGEKASQASTASESPDNVRGQVVWLADGFENLHGVASVPEAQQRGLALQTDDRRLLPLLEDARGRAFRKDPRLRDRPVELVVRRFPNTCVVQVVKVYFVDLDQRLQADYWCDVCAIAMFEEGPCDCCQQPNRLRLRPVTGE